MTDELNIDDAHDNLTRAVRDYAQANTPGAVLDHYIVVYDVMLPAAASESGIDCQETTRRMRPAQYRKPLECSRSRESASCTGRTNDPIRRGGGR